MDKSELSNEAVKGSSSLALGVCVYLPEIGYSIHETPEYHPMTESFVRDVFFLEEKIIRYSFGTGATSLRLELQGGVD